MCSNSGESEWKLTLFIITAILIFRSVNSYYHNYVKGNQKWLTSWTPSEVRSWIRNSIINLDYYFSGVYVKTYAIYFSFIYATVSPLYVLVFFPKYNIFLMFRSDATLLFFSKCSNYLLLISESTIFLVCWLHTHTHCLRFSFTIKIWFINA